MRKMKIEDQYRELCYKLNNDIGAVSTIRHNRAQDKIRNLVEQIRKMDDKTFLLELINDSDPRVRMSSSINCLRMNVYVDESLAMLDALLHSKVEPWIRCNARFTIELWNEGKLK